MKTTLNSQLIGSHMNKVKQNRNLISDALAYDFIVVVVANAPAGDVGREEVQEGEGGAQEGERRKG